MNYGRLGTAFAGMFSAGALTMYLFDPQRGRTRRVVLKDALAHSRHELGKFAGRFGRDFGHRVEGAVAETENLFHREQASDYVLEQRVRSVIGRTVSHPHAINVSCKDGCVTLSGWIMANEGEDLDKAVESIKGVAEVSTFLNTTNHPEHISDLQGGTPRKRLPEYLRQSWSPTARVAAGGFGISLLAYGFTRRQPGIGLGGAVLLARSIFNRPLPRMAGIGSKAGLRIQKTIHINASPLDLYEFWVNPENYSKVFTHINQVTREGEEIYRWHLAGPAGVPLSWTGTITRRIPGKLVEWHSTPGASIENHGTIRVDSEKDGRTRVQIQMSYTPPAGLLGHALAALLGLDPKSLMDKDFVQLKALFEQGVTRVHGRDVLKPEVQAVHPSAS